MKKGEVSVIFTGGTISMTIDERVGSAIPSLSGEEIMSMVTNIDKIANINIINFGDYPGPHMDIEKLLKLKEIVLKELNKPEVSGVVVTHGTDSLEETAYFLDLAIDHVKPIIVIGAMRNSSELGYDGPSNLAAGVCSALSFKAKNKGVLVVMNNEVNAASEVTKTNTLSLDTFKSLCYGPLGVIDNNKLILHRQIINRQHIEAESMQEKVDLIKSVLGMDSSFIDFCIEKGSKGIVIEAMGRGNLPPMMLEGVQRAIDKKIPVIIVSRCPSGRVFDSYGYEGAGRMLRNMGCIFGGELSGPKARIKLMLALAKTEDISEIRQIFEQGYYED